MPRCLPILVLALASACDRSGPRETLPEATGAAPDAGVDAAPVEPEPATATTGLAALARLRLGMRPGLAPDDRPTRPDEAVAAIGAAGGSLACDDISWVSDEDGVLDGTCEGSLALAGQPTRLHLTFRRFEIPGEDGRPGLLTIQVFGPPLGAPELGPWLEALAAELEAAHGPGSRSGADLRWRLSDRFVLLHDPRGEPCGGRCVGTLWIGGWDHPELAPRGFGAP